MEELRQRILIALIARAAEFLGLLETLILTTAAPFSATSSEKSGSPPIRGAAAGEAGAMTPAGGAAPTGAALAAPTSAFERW